ncbi:MAG: DUF433 domain-containing protein [Treponema sp.]|nr:DUF433 domain-containing protein [Treponema sp.]
MTYLGKGVYTLPTAAKILGINSQKMRRWVNGYTYQKDLEHRSSKPIFKTEFKYNSDDVIISFLDLAELLFIKTFIQYGISVQKIKKAAIVASELLKTSHPFAIKKIYTDGKSIFAKIAQEEKDSSLLDLLRRQYQFGNIIEPTLFKCIDFDSNNNAERWWPQGKKGGVVLDPSRNMGQPILNEYNVRTELIYELYKNKHSINEISDWYELDKKAIENAINFEKGLAA